MCGVWGRRAVWTSGVSSEQFQEMKGDLPGCREEGSVEELVRKAEQRNKVIYSLILLEGWTRDDAPDEARMKELGDKMSDEIFEVHGKHYISQKTADLYQISGSARDWFYSEEANTGNEFRSAGYAIRLRDTGQYGINLPPDQVSGVLFQVFYH